MKDLQSKEHYDEYVYLSQEFILTAKKCLHWVYIFYTRNLLKIEITST